jgi:nitroreductase
MNCRIIPVGPLATDQVRSVLASAAFAPSAHNSQPWRFRCTTRAIELYADFDRALPVTDPDHQELLLACGAAVMNLRLAIRTHGRRYDLRLLPDPKNPDLLASLRPTDTHPIAGSERQFADAIERRRTHRRPFATTPVPIAVRNELRRAAELEQAWLAALHGPQQAALQPMLRTAQRIQLSTPGFLAEWRHWVSHTAALRDGARGSDVGWRSEPAGIWVSRDPSTTGTTPGPGKDTEPEPLTMVIGSSDDSRLSRLRAGQAMQRVLLAATAAGLSASFVAQLIEVPDVRADLRALLGGGIWPQAVLRLGYASPIPGVVVGRPIPHPATSSASALINTGRTRLTADPLTIERAIQISGTGQRAGADGRYSAGQRSSTGMKFRSAGPT